MLHCLKRYKILDEIIHSIEKTMETWRTELRAGDKCLAAVKIQKATFLTICNSDDATQSHSQEMHRRIQTQ